MGFFEMMGILFLPSVVAVFLLRIVGWHVAQPVDPDLAVTLVDSARNFIPVWLGLTLLSAVAASIGTVIAGRRLPEAGVFAAGIGLASLALRGGSMQMVLSYGVSNGQSSRQAVMISMALDCLLWVSIMAVVWVVTALVRKWLWSESPNDSQEGDKPKTSAKPDKPVSLWAGWPALAGTTFLAVFIIWATISRTPVASIARGQVIASIAAGLYIGALATRYFTGLNNTYWYALAAPLIGLIAYLLGFLNSDMSWAEGSIYKFYAFLATTPPHDLVRGLPIEYVAVGVAAALAGFWSGERVEHAAEHELT